MKVPLINLFVTAFNQTINKMVLYKHCVDRLQIHESKESTRNTGFCLDNKFGVNWTLAFSII